MEKREQKLLRFLFRFYNKDGICLFYKYGYYESLRHANAVKELIKIEYHFKDVTRIVVKFDPVIN